MKKPAATLAMILLAAQISHAQPGNNADPRLVASIQGRMDDSYNYAKKFTEIADRASVAYMACLGVTAGVLTGGASLVGTVGAGATAVTIASAGGAAGAVTLPGVVYAADFATHSFKDVPIRTQEGLAPLVEKINESHRNGNPVTLKLINKNMDLLREERMKILSTTLNGSLKSELKDRVRCGYLSKKATAKLAEISVTEYRYLHAVYTSLVRGYPVRVIAGPYSQNASYKEVFEELSQMNQQLSEYVTPAHGSDAHQNGRIQSPVQSQAGTSVPASERSDGADRDSAAALK